SESPECFFCQNTRHCPADPCNRWWKRRSGIRLPQAAIRFLSFCLLLLLLLFLVLLRWRTGFPVLRRWSLPSFWTRRSRPGLLLALWCRGRARLRCLYAAVTALLWRLRRYSRRLLRCGRGPAWLLCWGSSLLNGWRLIRPAYLRCLALPCLSRGYWPTWLSRWTLLHGRRQIGTRLSLRRRARLDRR